MFGRGACCVGRYCLWDNSHTRVELTAKSLRMSALAEHQTGHPTVPPHYMSFSKVVGATVQNHGHHSDTVCLL
ncbi:unnamed protein product [Leptidea sinapis]|uniref:Uncharacterized protein n=1 Tax=Leptidea sinapis TaxID=189913 RepID=A0A5E4Q8W5_9NEOP|nr:unnamed protein product [Leptidea sinapis]